MSVKEFAQQFQHLTFAELSDLELAVFNERFERMRSNPGKAQREVAEHDRRNGTNLGLRGGLLSPR